MLYSKDFFKTQRPYSLNSAKGVVPYIVHLIQPQSVLDLGCGTGTWLSVFLKKHRIKDVVGVDGDYISRRQLEIPKRKFMSHDLEQPLNLDRQFDLVMSLEVAEHLPEESAKTFIQSIVNHGPVILFSAAVPDQGGVHHVNEQWQDYWINLFKEKGYQVIDCLRERFWNSDIVGWWYAQNMFLFVEKSYLEQNPELLKLYKEQGNPGSFNKVHPNNPTSKLS